MIKRIIFFVSLMLVATNPALADKGTKKAIETKTVSIYVTNNTPHSLELKADYTETADTILSTHEVKANAQNQKVGESKIGGKVYMVVDAIFSTTTLIGGSVITYSENGLDSKVSVTNGNNSLNGHTYHLNAVNTVNNDGSLSLLITAYE